MNDLITQEIIEQRIFLIRNQKLMIDRDLAELYGVETKHLKNIVDIFCLNPIWIYLNEKLRVKCI